MSSLSRSLSPPLELEIQTNQILVAESALDAIASDLSLTTVVAPSSDVHKSNLKHLIDHFSHEHPLILYEGGKTDVVRRADVSETIVCSICRYSVSEDGPIYSCTSSECDFFLHKSCAEFPKAIRSVFHPQHLLFLSDPLYWWSCAICDDKYQNLGFGYQCVGCKVILHIKCALQYNIQDPQVHDHSFIQLKPSLFTCDACGIEEETKCVSFLCTTCQLQVHNNINCSSSSSSFPLTVKQIRHPHELRLTFWSQLYSWDLNYDHNTCMICGCGMNGVLCFYYCGDCQLMAHVTCALSMNLRDEYDYEEALEELENEDQDQNPTTTLAPSPTETTNEISQVGQKATDLRHFSHPQHCLILSNEPKLNEFCDGCTMSISIPYYICADDQCDFLLHKQCFELPRKIQHPFHNHQLTLKAKAVGSWDENPFGIFRCECCRAMCNGFTYTCGYCEVFIDVGCGLFTNPLPNSGHECALTLVDTGEAKCSACGLDCISKFVCKRCDFNIDYGCASLPHTISHDCPKPEWGIRPYILITYPVDDASEKYYCDICEEPRIHNHWFYYCKNCDYSAHPECLLAKDRIKFGRTYLSKNHPHSITLVKVANKKGVGHPPCASCCDPCVEEVVPFCTECDIYFHHWQKSCWSAWINL